LLSANRRTTQSTLKTGSPARLEGKATEHDHPVPQRVPGQARYFLAYGDGVPEGKPGKVNLLSLSLGERLALHEQWVGRPNNQFELDGCRLKARLAKIGNTVYFKHLPDVNCNEGEYHRHSFHDAYQDAVLSWLKRYGLVARREKWSEARDARSDILVHTSRGRSISVEIQRRGQGDVITGRRTDARLKDVELVVWIWRRPPRDAQDAPRRLNLVYDEDADEKLEVRPWAWQLNGRFHAGHGLGAALAADKLFYHKPRLDGSAPFPAHWCGLPLACPAMMAAQGGAL
jgi:hypothetical protein